MKHTHNIQGFIKTALIVLAIIFSFSASGQYVLQSSDVSVANDGNIADCSITDFNVVAYQYGNIEIPEQIDGITIVRISGNPFSGWVFNNKGITAVTFPSSLEQIGSSAFADNAITNVTLPSTLKAISDNAFSGNSGLTSITLPINSTSGFAGWEDSDGQSYAGGDAITDFTLTYTAQFVTSYTLTDADVTIINGVITACSNSIIGSTIIIPDTLQGQEVIGIDANVFSGLNIKDITLPTPEALGFTNWLSGTGTSYNGGVRITDFTTSYTAQFITNYTLIDADVTVSNGVISACSNVNNANIVVIPNTLQNQEVIGIDANVFSSYSSISEIILPTPEASNFINWLSGTGVSYVGGSSVISFSASYTAQYNSNWYTLTDNDTYVDEYGRLQAVSYNFAAKNIIIPDFLNGYAVKEILWGNFEDVGLIKIKLPSTLEVIGDYAFIHNQIESIEMPDRFIEMGAGCFNDNRITEINGNPSNGFVYAKNNDGTNDSTTIMSYGGGEKVIDFIPANVLKLGVASFAECKLTSITIPDNIVWIDSYCFYENPNLTPTLPSYVDWVDSEGASYVGGSVITDITQAYIANLPHTLTDDDVVIQEGQIIDYNKNKYTRITVPQTLHGQTVTGVREGVFENKNILEMYLPIQISLAGFDGWINFDGNAVSLSNGTYKIKDFSISYIAKLPQYTLTSMDVVISGNSLSSCNFPFVITDIIVPNMLNGAEVKILGASSLREKGITSVQLPSTLVTIKDYALSKNALTEITIPANVVTISFCAFWGGWPNYTNTLKKVTFEPGSRLKTIGNYAFKQCKVLEEINLPEGLETIGLNAFFDCSLKNVTIPASIKTIGLSAFQEQGSGNNSLVSVRFVDNSYLQYIGVGAFSSNSDLPYFNLPTSAYAGFLYWNCKGMDTDKPNYAQGENTKIFTAEYIAQYPYTLSCGNVNITDGTISMYNGGDIQTKYIIIPDILCGQAVTKIKENGYLPAFANYNLKGITLPSTLEYIPNYSFFSNYLNTITIPNKVYHIGANAFGGITADSLLLPTLTTEGFAGWISGQGNLVELEDGYYVMRNYNTSYDAVYEVHFVDYDGILIKTELAKHANSATPPNNPERTGYTFTGWDTDCSSITKGITVTAQYVLSVYTISFVDWNGTVLSQQQLNYGQNVIEPSSPVRTGYTFVGWDVAFSNITGDLTITAQYSKNNANNYTVTFVDWEGTVLSTQTVVEADAANEPIQPSRIGYTFTGWDNSYNNVLANTTLTAQYDINTFVVKFYNYDNSLLKTETVDYAKSAVVPLNPTRTGYTFAGWNADFSNITSTLSVYAIYTINSYKAVFSDWDGFIFKEQTVKYKNSAIAPFNPVRPGYSFNGWDKAYNSIQQDITITAKYNKNADENIAIGDYSEGGVVFYIYQQGDAPYKEDTISGLICAIKDAYSYSLDWSPLGANFYGPGGINVLIGTSTQLGSGKANTAKIVNHFGKPKYDLDKYNYPAYMCDTMTTNGYSDWFLPDSASLREIVTQNKMIDNVSLQNGGNAFTYSSNQTLGSYWTSSEYNADKTYFIEITYGNVREGDKYDEYNTFVRAIREFSLPKGVFNVYFIDWNRNPLETQTVVKGSAATTPTSPTRTGYTFTCWDVNFSNITENIMVTAQYTINKYTITFKDYDGTVLKTETVEYEKSVTAPTDPTRTGYTFIGWDANFSKITTDLTVTAQYSQNGTTNYTVIFKDWDNTVLSTQTVAVNNAAIAPANPTCTGYTFTAWDTDFSKITSDVTVIAQYSINSYAVTFKDFDGTVLKSETVEYEKSATAPIDPNRIGYKFTGWDIDFSKVTSDITVTAQYTLPTSLIETIKENEEIIVYPNPAKNSFVIEIKKPYEIPDFDRNISILNSVGELVYHSDSFSTKQSIDIGYLQSGVYFVKIGCVIKKIIKE